VTMSAKIFFHVLLTYSASFLFVHVFRVSAWWEKQRHLHPDLALFPDLFYVGLVAMCILLFIVARLLHWPCSALVGAGAVLGHMIAIVGYVGSILGKGGGYQDLLHSLQNFGFLGFLSVTLITGPLILLGWLIGGVTGLAAYTVERVTRELT